MNRYLMEHSANYSQHNIRSVRGRPRYGIEAEHLLAAYELLGDWSMVANSFGVSLAFVYRRLQKAKVKVKRMYSF